MAELWAMDLDGKGIPVRAHRVVNTEMQWRKSVYPEEVRVTACGERRTAESHPDGWWTTEAGFLPLLPEHVHCGLLLYTCVREEKT